MDKHETLETGVLTEILGNLVKNYDFRKAIVGDDFKKTSETVQSSIETTTTEKYSLSFLLSLDSLLYRFSDKVLLKFNYFSELFFEKTSLTSSRSVFSLDVKEPVSNNNLVSLCESVKNNEAKYGPYQLDELTLGVLAGSLSYKHGGSSNQVSLEVATEECYIVKKVLVDSLRGTRNNLIL